MKTILNGIKPERRSCKDMLIYEMQRSEKLEHELFKYKRIVRDQERYIDYLERKIFLY